MRTLVLAIALLTAGSLACKSPGSSERAPTPQKRGPVAGTDAAVKAKPRSKPTLPPTTAPSMALRHMRNQIANYQRMSSKRTLMLGQYRAYVDWLSLRARFLGALSDYDTLLRLVDRVVNEYPKKPDAYLMRASVRAGLHLFTGAQTDLDKAIELGLAKHKADKMRATLLAARGDLPGALKLRRQSVDRKATLFSLGDLATTYAELGEDSTAEKLFARALKTYRDRSPFAVAWLLFQRGLMHDRAGRTGRARDSYRLAYERLPGAPIAGHLAGAQAATGNPQTAIKLLRTIANTSEDPEHHGALAELLHKTDPRAAAEALAKAKAGYRTLTSKHMLAFADHAARFWLAAGQNPARALELARANLNNRPTDAAYQLILDAAHAAKIDGKQQCALADKARGKKRASAYLLFAVARAYRGCGRTAAADATLKAAAAAKRKR